ncbi:hypothetical protein XA68_10929 [Ophiocordyceps unilateralis]|uniref:IEC3 subunit of the Ino80 complex, chromatin re-modelling-domain-containing protein n=1 Tax=Ophiocordyceps unilateralis TaxID=268505 RepID=A0A2A9PGW7_OPHUN|nr:hypothetical protein XA68_10929 [Ophiocordyceps unilateralis]
MDDDEGVARGGQVSERGRSSGYKSWKKKYRKMRIVFDRKMQQGEELHRKEDRASATVKRLAVENDRLLDLLLEINKSPQMPPERRIDVSLTTTPSLFADDDEPTPSSTALKRLEQLLSDVPHLSYSDARDARRPYLADLMAPDGDARPANFLSADDIDNYMHAIDTAIDPDAQIPTLAPRAHTGAHGTISTHPHLKNPTSVTNWLRKNAPKIFLQDGEHHHRNTSAEDDADAATSTPANARKARNAAGIPRSERNKSTAKTKRSRLAAPEWDPGVEDVDADGAATPSSAAAAARGKRKRDGDTGYRPGGSSSRPAKKKRKSDVDGVSSAARRSKKEAAAMTGNGRDRDD